ncbi:MAG TPA: cytochrome c [Vicinamibacterales bacterium]|nr:cytochrome c [Vicinamibacterales bacterium]
MRPRAGSYRTRSGLALATAVCALAIVQAQDQGRGRGAAQPPGPPPGLLGRLPAVDEAAHDRGRAIWASECINCHGSQARGSEAGPNIIRTKTVNYDRFNEKAGSVLGPFLKAGHPAQTRKTTTGFTDDEVVALANFLRQRVNDTMRQSPLFTVADILVGDAAAGEAYFKGEGGCAACHTESSRSLAGIGTRMQPVDLQQRLLFPFGAGRGRGAGRGGPPAPNPNAITVSVTTPGGLPPLTGVLVEESDFYVTFRQADGTVRTVRRAPSVKIVKTNPLQAHVDLLDRITDKQIHDVVAYLARMK